MFKATVPKFRCRLVSYFGLYSVFLKEDDYQTRKLLLGEHKHFEENNEHLFGKLTAICALTLKFEK